jgi:hypothetical protein
MKKYSLLITLIVCCAFGLMSSPSYAQGRILSEAQLEGITNTKVENCAAQNSRIDPGSVIPTSNAREFTTDRIAKTLNGIWLGQVSGDSADTSIDYFWIVDTKNNEGLIIALRNGKQSMPSPKQAAIAPKLTFLMCPNEGYIPSKDTPMIHQFIKVGDSIEDAPKILEKATGVKLKGKANLSDMWAEIVASQYFNGLPAVAFAGGLFKPIQIGLVANPVGPAGHSLNWGAEYRGGGSTQIKYTPGVPLTGVEHAEFVGTTTNQGDFLVSSPGNGKIWKVEASMPVTTARKGKDGKKGKGGLSDVPIDGSYCLAFDSVVLGPLQ